MPFVPKLCSLYTDGSCGLSSIRSQRGLNNIFAYDLVPTVEVIEAAIQAARRYNDLPTAIRAIEGLRQKVEKVSQYDEYLKELKPLMEELGEYPYRAVH